jgi:hypothetical protein
VTIPWVNVPDDRPTPWAHFCLMPRWVSPTDPMTSEGPNSLANNNLRLSANTRRHINVHGHYSFHLPDLGGPWRPLRDPHQSDPDEQD